MDADNGLPERGWREARPPEHARPRAERRLVESDRGRGLHRARPGGLHRRQPGAEHAPPRHRDRTRDHVRRSEEHTSELQSLAYLVCRLLLEKKKAHPTIRVATSDAHITLARKTTR